MTSAYPSTKWTHDELGRADALFRKFEYYGYEVASEPFEGMFDLWFDELSAALSALEVGAELHKKRYNFRGHTKTFIVSFNARFPEPCFGVLVK